MRIIGRLGLYIFAALGAITIIWLSYSRYVLDDNGWELRDSLVENSSISTFNFFLSNAGEFSANIWLENGGYLKVSYVIPPSSKKNHFLEVHQLGSNVFSCGTESKYPSIRLERLAQIAQTKSLDSLDSLISAYADVYTMLEKSLEAKTPYKKDMFESADFTFQQSDNSKILCDIDIAAPLQEPDLPPGDYRSGDSWLFIRRSF